MDIANAERPVVEVSKDEECRLKDLYMSVGGLASNRLQEARADCEANLLQPCGLICQVEETGDLTKAEFHCEQSNCSDFNAKLRARGVATELYTSIRKVLGQ